MGNPCGIRARGAASIHEWSKMIIDTTVAQMTKDELRDMIETTVEQKLLELLGDPDEGLPIRKSVHERLLRQKRAVTEGERGEASEHVVRRLGIE